MQQLSEDLPLTVTFALIVMVEMKNNYKFYELLLLASWAALSQGSFIHINVRILTNLSIVEHFISQLSHDGQLALPSM